jgi:hypothetical protein
MSLRMLPHGADRQVPLARVSPMIGAQAEARIDGLIGLPCSSFLPPVTNSLSILPLYVPKPSK